jgi:hypothetical protein
MSLDRKLTELAAETVTLSVLLLGTCPISAPMDARADEPGRVKATGYPAVEDVPPRPDKPAMTAEEQLKLKKELTAARDGQTRDKSSAGTHSTPVKP